VQSALKPLVELMSECLGGKFACQIYPKSQGAGLFATGFRLQVTSFRVQVSGVPPKAGLASGEKRVPCNL